MIFARLALRFRQIQKNINRVFIYTHLDLINILTHCCYHILFQVLFCFFLLIFKTKGRDTCSLLLRPTILHIGVESGVEEQRVAGTHPYIFTLFVPKMSW